MRKAKSAKRWMLRNQVTISKINMGIVQPTRQFQKQYQKAIATLSK